ncbi:MAG: hypothetical protein CVU40_10380 [Chloroflexi bacterium HGW-Chloroflexi-2]|jgi:hypothetical protein|nr:MAG: hypothetical protein CVU40_10380 [Chloroflexi bacterium HGW-Chloroflexi-2]
MFVGENYTRKNLILHKFFSFVCLFLPVLYLECVQYIAGNEFSYRDTISRLILTVLMYALLIIKPRKVDQKWFFPWLGILLLGFGVVAIYISYQFHWMWLSGLGLAILWAIGIGILDILADTKKMIWKIISWSLGTLILSGILVVFNQIIKNFSEEEFFIALQVIILSVYLFFILIARNHLYKLTQIIEFKNSFTVSRLHLFIIVILLTLAGGGFVIKRYQGSFYPKSVPIYPGITTDQPFLCEEIDLESNELISGSEVLIRYKELLESNPNKGVPEFASLAIIENDQSWAAQFHESLLVEVREKKYTGPANSIKYDQYSAAIRAYYYGRMLSQFPGLFSSSENEEIVDWFHAINRRALTVEWVDLLYSTAFTMWPIGPYENQEIGIGLLAILEKEKLADPNLSIKNRQYLEENRRGWEMRFRNTDDALIYQQDWITNAYFQNLYWGSVNPKFVDQSFEWLLNQALPNGQAPQYNFPFKATLINPMIFGAYLTDNPNYTWMAAKAIQALPKGEEFIKAYPGIELITELVDGEQPAFGSCLLYGNSGLPNQHGPLAPDKIVLRSGWNDEDIFILLNLRFTGWHRYKGTGTVTTIYAGEVLVSDNLKNSTYSWLPAGRSLIRDKRIPIENLNGFLIKRNGLDWVINKLIDQKSLWTQDPPYYASVEDFKTSTEKDYAKITMNNWYGTSLSREVYAFNQGVISILDRTDGNTTEITWHQNTSANCPMNKDKSNTCGKIFYLVYNGKTIKQFSETEQNDIVKINLQKEETLITLVTSVEWENVKYELIESNLVIKGGHKLIVIPLLN